VFRHALATLALLAFAVARGADRQAAPAAPPPAEQSPDGVFARVTVDPARTSIYIGSVSLRMLPLERRVGVYEADYSAKVFPFFFYNEHGRLSINVSDDDLRQLARGESVAFAGHARTSGGAPRRIEGRAVPDAAAPGRGKIKVRVWVGRLELVFNTTYRFTGGG